MVKIGVFGVGYLGKIHLSQLKEIKNFEIIGFYDPDVAASQVAEAEFNIKSILSEDILIQICDAILVAATTTEHYKLAKKCLLAGKHIFIEKPLTETLEQAQELIAIAELKGICAQVGYVERFNPAFIAAKEFGLQPLFIESHRLSEFNPRGSDVSVILDLLIHDIDVILSLVDSKIISIQASGVSIISAQPDIANARIEFENGCVANLTASRISIRKERKMRIFQHEAYILIDFLHKVTECFSINALDEELNPFSFIIDTGAEKKIVKMDKPEIIPTNAIRTELEAFLNAIQSKVPTPVSLTDGYKSMVVAFEIINQIKDKEIKLRKNQTKVSLSQ